ncbi:Hypothetical protein A7982_00875 [Minicystis rosea]|nr:Hypothetical protein A7982_00875 [Minicystis rosea]
MADTTFDLWLELEHGQPHAEEHTSEGFANVQVRLPDGRRYALNVWTFAFLPHARFPWPYDDTSGLPAEYVLPPDLFVERLDRPTLERVVRQLLANREMKSEWLCPPEEASVESDASPRHGDRG